MRAAGSIAALASLFASQAAAHTTLQYFWPTSSEADSTQSCVRLTSSNNPVQDVTSADMACNIDGTKPAASVCSVTAGSTISVEWHHESRTQHDSDDPIAASHKGPIMTYMAKVDDAATITDVTSLDWFKIAETGYSNGVWAVDTLYKEGTGVWPATIPTNIPDGQYLLRGEILALHSATSYPGAQFYIGCVQLSITGGTGGTPSPVVKFPGAYASTDPGVTINIYNGLTDYTIPGPAVYGSSSGSSSGSASSVKASSAAPATTSKAATTSTAAATTSKAATTSATSLSPVSASSIAAPAPISSSSAAAAPVQSSSSKASFAVATTAAPTTLVTSTKAATTSATTSAASAGGSLSSEAVNKCLDDVNTCIASAQGDSAAMDACAAKRTQCY